jgi:hypothetical protein
MPSPIELSDLANISVSAVLGGYIGLKIVNECVNEVFSAIRRAINPKKSEYLQVQTHELCLQQRAASDQGVLREIAKLSTEVQGLRKILLAYLTREGKILNMEDFKDLGVL